MSTTVAMFTGLSGLNANSASLDVIGNNIANVNTNAFKSSRMILSNSFSQTIRGATGPSEFNGGTNPAQVGLGVRVAGTQRLTTQGSISGTGDPRDLAIEGEGFFVVDRSGENLFTRAGGFRLDANNNLVTPEGYLLQGFSADENYIINEGVLGPINIALGGRTVAAATANVGFTGNLNAGGDAASQGARILFGGTATDGLRVVAGAVPDPGAGNLLVAANLLTDIEDPDLPGSGTPLFAVGQSIQVSGATRGTSQLAPQEFEIDATTTVEDLMDFLNEALLIQDTGSPNPDGRTPGVTLDPTTGFISAVGNVGETNDLDVPPSAVRLLDSSGAVVRLPLSTGKAAAADGESIRTTFIAYDSLGNVNEINVTMVLETKNDLGTVWRYFADSPDDTDPTNPMGTGQLAFDTFGRLATTGAVDIQLDRTGTGADPLQTITLHFGEGDDAITAFSDRESSVRASVSDGSASGTLQSFSVGRDGTIYGAFSNSLVLPLAQVALATFSNAAGLTDVGSNLFQVSANSGQAVVGGAGQFGTGQIVGGALELSNVDLSQEFINLILASTGYSASSRVITTADQLIQQLLVIGR